MNNRPVTIELPNQVLERADALIPKLEAVPAVIAFGPPDRAVVLRLAILRGLYVANVDEWAAAAEVEANEAYDSSGDWVPVSFPTATRLRKFADGTTRISLRLVDHFLARADDLAHSINRSDDPGWKELGRCSRVAALRVAINRGLQELEGRYLPEEERLSVAEMMHLHFRWGGHRWKEDDKRRQRQGEKS